MDLERRAEQRRSRIRTAGRFTSLALTAAFVASSCQGGAPSLEQQGNGPAYTQTQGPDNLMTVNAPDGYLGPAIGAKDPQADNFGGYFTECQSIQQVLETAITEHRFPFPIVPEWYDQIQIKYQLPRSNQSSFMEVTSLTTVSVYHNLYIIAPFDVTPVDPHANETSLTENYVIHEQYQPDPALNPVDEYRFVEKGGNGNTTRVMIVFGKISPGADNAYPTHGIIKAGQIAINYNASGIRFEHVPAYFTSTLYIGFDKTGRGTYEANPDDFATDTSGKPLYCTPDSGTYTEPS